MSEPLGKREQMVLWAFCWPCMSNAVPTCFLEHQRQERGSSYGSSNGRRGNGCSKLPSKQFLLNHGDPWSRLDGLSWPSGFIQLRAATTNFKSGCITMHVNEHEMVFRSWILMTHEDENLVWGPFWRNQTSKKECKYGYISHAYRCEKLGLGPIILTMGFFNKVQNILASLTWKVLVAMLFDILVLLMFANRGKREEQWSSQKWDSCRNGVMAELVKAASASASKAAKNQILRCMGTEGDSR